MKNFTKLFGFAVIISFLGGIPLTSYALPSWKPLTPWQYTGSDIYFNDGNGKVAISTTTVSASLTLDVEGQIGATEYCDEDGNNCFVATDVGGTGLWESTGGVLRPVSGTIDYATEDFLFGSPQLADVGDATHDKRMFFDKSKGAFRVGGTAWTRWDDVNVGNFSVAMGNNTTASGDYSFAMGNNLTASGMYSVAMGSGGNATADYSFAMGDSQATGQFSVAMGYLAAASGGSSVAMGSGTTASGAKSVAMGWYTTASGNRSMAMGEKAKANGEASFAFGEGVIANGANSIIFGLADITVVSGSSVAANVMGIVGGAVGISDTTPDGTLLLDVEGDIGAINYCDEDGNNCFVATDVGGTGLWSDQTTHISRTGIVLVDGTFNDASLTNISGAGTKMFFYPGKAAFRAGTVSGAQWDDANIGNYSFATGYSNEASGDYSTAVGYGLTASGDGSTAFGYYSRATGAQSFSLSASLASGGGAISLGGNGDFNSGIRGQRTEASGISSFAVQNAKASGWQSIAMGREAEASTNDAVAIGRWTTASGIQSLATGYYTQANGETSFAFGEGVIANGDNSIIFGLADSTVVSGSSVAANVMAIVGGAVGISDTTPDGSLLLDVEGQIGATEYCDENGANCIATTAMGGLWTDETTHISRTGIVAIDGQLGIGTSSPNAALHVVGRIDQNSGGRSNFIGTGAGILDDSSSNENIAIGYQSMFKNTSGDYGVAVGTWSMYNNSTGTNNVAIGNSALPDNTVGSYNTAIGTRAAYKNTGSYNTAIGSDALLNQQAGNNNTAVGHQAGKGVVAHDKSGGVFLGYQAGYNEIASDKLYIENSSSTTPLIGGDFALDEVYLNSAVGIGTSSPQSELDVSGTIQIADGGQVCDAAHAGALKYDEASGQFYKCTKD